jgi:hypothetical protein
MNSHHIASHHIAEHRQATVVHLRRLRPGCRRPLEWTLVETNRPPARLPALRAAHASTFTEPTMPSTSAVPERPSRIIGEDKVSCRTQRSSG